MPRTRGAARLAVSPRGGRTRIDEFRAEGSLKVLWPHPAPDGALEAVLLNTSGGLTGGDRLSVEARAGAGARLVLTTQAAERAYRADAGMAEVSTGLQAGPGARIDWLPQETILFDRSALSRRLTAEVAADATLLLAEAVIFGRRAMGEAVGRGLFRDRWEVRRDGRLVLADALRLEGDLAATLADPHGFDGAGAMATLALVGQHAESHLAPLRALLPPTAGASVVREGVLFVRILAGDGYDLRQHLVPVLTRLAGRALPRVWRL